MVMEESVHGEYRLSSLDHRYDEHRTAARWYRATAIVCTLDRAPQQEWPRWALLDVPFTGRARRRAETREITPLKVIRRIVAAHPVVALARPFATAIARAQRPPAQGHRPQARSPWLRLSETALVLGLGHPLAT